jgi:hypothetical protein
MHVQQGDYTDAMEDADRLFRVYPQSQPALLPSLAAMASDPKAKYALAARLSRAPPWRTQLLWDLARGSKNPLTTADLMMAMTTDGAVLRSEEVAPTLSRLVDAQRYLQAFLAWRQFAPDSSTALTSVRDGDFQGLDAPAPFVWALGQGAGASADMSEPPSPDTARSQSLHVTYDGFSAPVGLASQLLVLGPGVYRFTTRAYVAAALPDPRLSWTLTCADTGQTLFATDADAPLDAGWNTLTASAVVPGGACQGQWLRLITAPGDRPSGTELWFDHVAMTRLAAAPVDKNAAAARTNPADAQLPSMSGRPEGGAHS